MGQVSISGIDVTTFGDQACVQVYYKISLTGSDFTDADSNAQKQSLVSATRWIEQIGLTDPDAGTEIVPTVDDTDVPVLVIEGAYELARALILDPAILDNQSNSGNNIKAAGAGSARVEFFRPSDGTTFPKAVMRLLAPYISSRSANLFGCATGTGGKSSFKDAAFPGLTEGFK